MKVAYQGMFDRLTKTRKMSLSLTPGNSRSGANIVIKVSSDCMLRDCYILRYSFSVFETLFSVFEPSTELNLQAYNNYYYSVCYIYNTVVILIILRYASVTLLIKHLEEHHNTRVPVNSISLASFLEWINEEEVCTRSRYIQRCAPQESYDSSYYLLFLLQPFWLL